MMLFHTLSSSHFFILFTVFLLIPGMLLLERHSINWEKKRDILTILGGDMLLYELKKFSSFTLNLKAITICDEKFNIPLVLVLWCLAELPWQGILTIPTMYTDISK